MRFELRTGWRYLHGCHRDPIMQRFALIALAITGIGAGMIAWGAGGLGVIVLVGGMVATAVFALMSFLSVFTSVSVLGVALGVAVLTVVLGVTTGFQREFRDKVLGVNAHVVVRSGAGVADHADVVAIARSIDPDVIAVQPFDYQEVVATTGKGVGTGAAIKGIDPHAGRDVLDLERYLEAGSFDALAAPRAPGTAPPIIVGRGVAQKLGARLGDTITVVIPLSNQTFPPTSERANAPRTRRFAIAGIFYSGFEEYDRHLMFATIAETQALAERGDQVLGVELKIRDVDRAEAIARALERALGPPYEAISWKEMNAGLFEALAVQKLVLTVVLALIILVALVNMVAAIMMLVTDKTREIAILKSMGSSSGAVTRVFQTVGISIGGLGTAIGVVLGLVTSHVVGEHGFALDPKVYMIDRLPIDVRPGEVLLVALVALAISWIASTIPARAAAALSPGHGLRYD